MNAIFYLSRTKLKNQLKGLIKKPSRLIYLLIVIALLILTLVGGHAADEEPGRVLRNVDELAAIAAGLYLMMFLLSVNSGFSRGGNLFTMSDVNLLFPSPIRPQSILFHGLLQQMTTSLFVGFFLLFQYTTVHSAYGISYGQLLLLLVGYAIATFLGQVTAMLVYSRTSHDERRQTIWKAVFYVFSCGLILYLMGSGFLAGTGQFLPGVVAAVNGPVFHCFPVVGWLTLYAGGMLTGNGLAVLTGLLLCAAFLGLFILFTFRTDPDYYEDVIKSAELALSAITAKKEGTMTEAVPMNVRLGKTGLDRGWGANVFYHKHQIENRRSRKFLLSTNALIFAATLLVFTFFMESEGLLLLTNDGELMNRLIHPKFEVAKTYRLMVAGEVRGAAERLAAVTDLDGETIRPAQVTLLRETGHTAELAVTIHEGKNRQIRRMCAVCELTVKRLQRVAEHTLTLGDLPSGAWRYLTAEEVTALKADGLPVG